MLAKISIVTISLFTCAAGAGPLAPPAGPVAPTQRLAITSLPYTANIPGSYVLWSDLTGVAGANGITVNADNVTIDLNGFSVTGVAGSLDGIHVNAGHNGLAVLNGTVRDWGGGGVDALLAESCRFIDVSSISNGANGFDASSNSSFLRCHAEGNANVGFFDTGNGCVYENCTASGNASGIIASTGCTIRGCTAESNTVSGIVSNGDGSITGSSARNNGDAGIAAGAGTVVRDCSSGGNLTGISASTDTLISGNACGANADIGIEVQASNARVENNLCTGNGNGIRIDAGGSNNIVSDNTVRGNALNYDFPSSGNLLRLELSEIPQTVLWASHITLAGDLFGAPGANGVTIDADDVTLDLNGFSLIGVPGSQSGVFVDTSNGFGNNVTIRNGAIHNWDADGVHAGTAVATTVEDIWCDTNAGEGINVANQSTVTDCLVSNHPLNGITASSASTVINCRARACLAAGIAVQDGSIALNCASLGNGDGFSAFEGSVIQDCTSIGNTNFGAFLDFGSTITGCTIRHSGNSGIECVNENVVEGNRLSLNASAGVGSGINVTGSLNRIVGNSVISIAGAGLIGINVQAFPNTVHSNSATGGAPNYQAVAGNDIAPIGGSAGGVALTNVVY